MVHEVQLGMLPAVFSSLHPVDDCSSSPNLFAPWHSKTPAGRCNSDHPVLADDRAADLLNLPGSPHPVSTFRSEQQTASYQPGIIRKAITTCSCSLAGRRRISGRAVSFEIRAGAGLYDHAYQMAFAVREIGYQRR